MVNDVVFDKLSHFCFFISRRFYILAADILATRLVQKIKQSKNDKA